MIVELTPEEIETIDEWYQSAAGDSATDRDAKMFALLEKLSIRASHRDLWLDDSYYKREPKRAEVIASNEAIKAYRQRHLDYDEVQEANRKQPI